MSSVFHKVSHIDKCNLESNDFHLTLNDQVAMVYKCVATIGVSKKIRLNQILSLKGSLKNDAAKGLATFIAKELRLRFNLGSHLNNLSNQFYQ